MNNLHTSKIIAVALCLLASPMARADDAPKPPVQTLAQALALAEAPKSDLYIAVGAEKIALPEGTPAAKAGDTVSQIATVFGRRVGGFGNVDALAPPTITVVYVPPDKPNPYDGMEPKKLVKMLTGTFNSDQWKAFLSEKGVGYGDFESADQKALFAALFPAPQMKLERFSQTDRSTTEIGPDALKEARLRLAFNTAMALPQAGKTGSFIFASVYTPPNQSPPFMMVNSASEDVEREYGATVRAVVVNTPKANDLEPDDDALHRTVPLAGIHTVDDAVRAIAAATGREIYADTRYAERTLTLTGPTDSVRAIDLMRALALCVGGTYRRVGPVYVLTDDLVGLGAKHELWREFESKAKAMLTDGSEMHTPSADDVPYTVQDIPWTADGYGLTQQQQDDYWKKWRKNPAQFGSGLLQTNIPFAKLSPAQKDAARHIQEQNAKEHTMTTLDGEIMLQAEPMAQITLPSLDAPILVTQSYDNLLPYPPLTEKDQRAAAAAIESPATGKLGGAPPPPILPLPKALSAFARRAIRAAPQSTDELNIALTAMKTLGLNELWLAVAPGATAAEDAASLTLLRTAVSEAKKSHIAVYPEVSLLAWGGHAPEALLDRTITGRTAKQDHDAAFPSMPLVTDTVTPFDPEVGLRLAAFIGKAGATPGVAGMVWRDAIAHGYERLNSDQGESDYLGGSLGYAIAGRLAFLRKEHTDPSDAHDNSYNDKRAHVRVPGFDDDFNRERALYTDWRTTRVETGQGLFQWLTSALPHSFATDAGRLPLIVPPANSTFSMLRGSWDDFTKPPVSVDYISAKGDDGQPVMGAIATEHLPSSLVYRVIAIDTEPSAGDSAVATFVSAALGETSSTENPNIVIDPTGHPRLLEQLARAEAASHAALNSTSAEVNK